MADSKNSFVVYTDIKETLDDLSDSEVAALFRGMVDYQVTGEDPKFSGTLKYIFIPIRQQMDRNNTKWERKKAVRAEAGRQGGIRSGEVRRAKAEAEANEANASQSKQNEANEANEAVNGTVNVNGNGTVTVTVSDGSDAESLSRSLISYLNEKSGGKYKPTEELTDRIGELLAAGYTEKDMIRVIDRKVAEWKDDAKMRSYLRPRTLFGDKFEEYVSGPVPIEVEEKQKKQEIASKLQEERSTKAESLSSILGRLKIIRDGPGGIKGAWDEYKELQDKKIVLEQDIEFIDAKLGRLAT